MILAESISMSSETIWTRESRFSIRLHSLQAHRADGLSRPIRAHRQHKIVVSMLQFGQRRQAPGAASIVHVVFRVPQGFFITSQTLAQFLRNSAAWRPSEIW